MPEEQKTKKVLIVDDEDIICIMLQRILSCINTYLYEFYTSANGEEGAEAITKHSPNLIFTDMQMPKKDGIYVIESAKKHNPDVPIIVMTGYAQQSKINQAKNLGVYVMQKPFTFDDVKKAIETVFDPSKNLEGNV